MAQIGSGVEYALHCLLYLIGDRRAGPSTRDLAEFQGLSPSFVAKLFTKLEKAGLVRSSEGVKGGFRLARPAQAISVLAVVDAIEGEKALFECREVRRRCVLYAAAPPPEATQGVCGIHAIMLEAEREMRRVLARYSLADIAAGVALKLPARLQGAAEHWFEARVAARGAGPRRGRGAEL